MPPLSAEAWQAEFDKYQQIPQYRERIGGMSLNEFKTIYWWEWTHRLLARLVGAAFLLPFLFFLWRGFIEPGLRARLWTLFGAGAALGAVGWWMVSSGLAGRVSVSQYRLAFHLTLACAIYSAILWTAQGLLPRPLEPVPRRLRLTAVALALLVLLQIYLGALVAGLDAGLVFNTWPHIDGAWIPSAERLWFESPAWRNLFENTLTVQFDHRMVAYLLWVVAVLHLADVIGRRRGGAIAQQRADACLRRHLAGRHRHRHVAAPGAAAACAAASGDRHHRADHRGHPRRAFVAATGGGSGRCTARRVDSAEDDMIELSRRGGIAVMRMNHGKANALDIELCDGLAAQFEACRRYRNTSDRADRAGRHVLGGRRPVAAERRRRALRAALPAGAAPALQAVFFFPKPVVAAINGHAIAGGCVLAGCADRRIAARGGGRIGVTELLVGVPFPSLAFEVCALRRRQHFLPRQS